MVIDVRGLHAVAALALAAVARVSVGTVVHCHCLDLLRPVVRAGELHADCDTAALLLVLMMIFLHMGIYACAVWMRS